MGDSVHLTSALTIESITSLDIHGITWVIIDTKASHVLDVYYFITKLLNLSIKRYYLIHHFLWRGLGELQRLHPSLQHDRKREWKITQLSLKHMLYRRHRMRLKMRGKRSETLGWTAKELKVAHDLALVFFQMTAKVAPISLLERPQCFCNNL